MHRYGHDYDRNFLERARDRMRGWLGMEGGYDRDYGFRGGGRDEGFSRGWRDRDPDVDRGYRGMGGYGRTQEWGGGGYGGYGQDRDWGGDRDFGPRNRGYYGGGMGRDHDVWERGRGFRGGGMDRDLYDKNRGAFGRGMRSRGRMGGRDVYGTRNLDDYGASWGGDTDYGTERYRGASSGGVSGGGYFRGYGIGTRQDYGW